MKTEIQNRIDRLKEEILIAETNLKQNIKEIDSSKLLMLRPYNNTVDDKSSVLSESQWAILNTLQTIIFGNNMSKYIDFNRMIAKFLTILK